MLAACVAITLWRKTFWFTDNNPRSHVRGDKGTIEGKRDKNGEWIVHWDKDSDNQRNVAPRSYSGNELEI